MKNRMSLRWKREGKWVLSKVYSLSFPASPPPAPCRFHLIDEEHSLAMVIDTFQQSEQNTEHLLITHIKQDKNTSTCAYLSSTSFSLSSNFSFLLQVGGLAAAASPPRACSSGNDINGAQGSPNLFWMPAPLAWHQQTKKPIAQPLLCHISASLLLLQSASCLPRLLLPLLLVLHAFLPKSLILCPFSGNRLSCGWYRLLSPSSQP